jgi:hypothetical protein
LNFIFSAHTSRACAAAARNAIATKSLLNMECCVPGTCAVPRWEAAPWSVQAERQHRAALAFTGQLAWPSYKTAPPTGTACSPIVLPPPYTCTACSPACTAPPLPESPLPLRAV